MNTNTNTTIAEMVTNMQNGYVRDRRHEPVAVWEVKQTIMEHFNDDNYGPIAIAVGNWMVCAGYSVMNRKDSEFLSVAGRVVALCVNGSHITVKNVKNNAVASVFSSNRVKAALYRAVLGDCDVVARKEELKPTVKASTAKKNSKKEERIVRIMAQFNCDRELAEKMAQ